MKFIEIRYVISNMKQKLPLYYYTCILCTLW